LRDGDIVKEFKPASELPISEKLSGIMSIMEALET
jgi:hypothetical protein